MQRSWQLAYELHGNFKLLLCSSGSSACVKSCGPWQWQLKCPTCRLSGSRVLRGTALLWSRCACGLSVMLSGRSASKMIAPLLLSVSWSFQYLRNHTCGSETIEHISIFAAELGGTCLKSLAICLSSLALSSRVYIYIYIYICIYICIYTYRYSHIRTYTDAEKATNFRKRAFWTSLVPRVCSDSGIMHNRC